MEKSISTEAPTFEEILHDSEFFFKCAASGIIKGFSKGSIVHQDQIEDLGQEIWMKCAQIKKIPTFESPGRAAAWIIRVSRNFTVDSLRKKNQRLENYAPNEEIFNLLENVPDQVEEETSNDVSAFLSLTEATVPENQWKVLEERIKAPNGKMVPFKHVAEKQKTGLDTALGRIRYCRLNVLKILADNPSFELPVQRKQMFKK